MLAMSVNRLQGVHTSAGGPQYAHPAAILVTLGFMYRRMTSSIIAGSAFWALDPVLNFEDILASMLLENAWGSDSVNILSQSLCFAPTDPGPSHKKKKPPLVSFIAKHIHRIRTI